MLHYTNDDGSLVSRCRFCNRLLKTGVSMNQGCGEICRIKHRKLRYRVITKEVKNDGKPVRFEEITPGTVHDK